MPDPTNTQISIYPVYTRNVAIAVLRTHTVCSDGLPVTYVHYQELAEKLICQFDHDAVSWAKEVLDVN